MLTLCETLLRMSAGERITGIANLIIPEVLIGEVAHKVDRLITPTCADAQVFFCLYPPVCCFSPVFSCTLAKTKLRQKELVCFSVSSDSFSRCYSGYG
ncbi:hypothetical protein C8256_08810 [Kluyvera genomosp. 2]|uniref:Uncharacterized protein n=1 Tax=Kluyvera genomosp. 2 TaxID=2774054 RepID=A0A2T2Y3R6_9ENTR|nr:hypothetical protein C8256_08810 [Kluyvera genomosp. 2]